MSTELYNAVIWEVRKAIMARGLTMAECDRLSGNEDGYTAKMLHPDTRSGREAGWQALEYLVCAVFPGGFRIRLRSLNGALSLSTQEKAVMRGRAGRLAIKDLAAFAGRRSGRARMEKIPPRRRSAIARKAARMRWKLDRARRKRRAT